MCRFITVLFINIFLCCDSARILGIISTPSYSHQILYRPLWKELLLRGHELMVLTTDPINDPLLTNLTEIDLHFTYNIWENITRMTTNKEFVRSFKYLDLYFTTVRYLIDQELRHPKVQTLIKNKTEHFDLVMAESLFPTMFAFAKRFNCPSIAMSSMEVLSGVYNIFGNPSHPVLNPNFGMPDAEKLTFIERVLSVLYNQIVNYMIRSLVVKEDLTVKKHFGENFPSLMKITSNISMLFINVNPIFHQIRPLVPAIIQIGGGTNLQPAKPLPEALKKILDIAKEGFIYFSLGTNIRSRDLPAKSLTVLLQAFSELPFKILWKFELEELPGKPENVMISKWFPQQDILRHPNIKLFITQGGLQSVEEATFNYVPMVGIPFFGDQLDNVKQIVSKGLGLAVDFESMTVESFKGVVLEVINDPKYSKKIKEVADLALDQPMTGLERAVWWTEYVLRHKGARHLRNPALDLPSYQYYLLDVVGFCLLITIFIIYLLLAAIKLSFRLIKYIIFKSKVKIN